MTLRISTIAAVALLTCTGQVRANTINFQDSVSPSGGYTVPDTFIRADNPTGNFETHSQIIAGSNTSFGPLRGMLQFDLTALGSLNPGSIDSVELVMHYSGNTGTSDSLTLDLYSTQAFVATAATWNDPDGDGDNSNDTDGGSLDSLLSSLTFDPSGVPNDYTFADSANFRTSVSNALAAGDKTLHLLMLDQNENTSSQSFGRWDSADSATAANYPELIINYSETVVPEPSALALFGFGVVPLLLHSIRRRRAARVA